jgi:hypothetical protein
LLDTFGMLLRLTAGSKEHTVQAQQLGPARVVMLFEPVGED